MPLIAVFHSAVMYRSSVLLIVNRRVVSGVVHSHQPFELREHRKTVSRDRLLGFRKRLRKCACGVGRNARMSQRRGALDPVSGAEDQGPAAVFVLKQGTAAHVVLCPAGDRVARRDNHRLDEQLRFRLIEGRMDVQSGPIQGVRSLDRTGPVR